MIKINLGIITRIKNELHGEMYENMGQLFFLNLQDNSHAAHKQETL